MGFLTARLDSGNSNLHSCRHLNNIACIFRGCILPWPSEKWLCNIVYNKNSAIYLCAEANVLRFGVYGSAKINDVFDVKCWHDVQETN